jgi:hypothetical protein
MKKGILITLVVITWCTVVLSQTPGWQWVKNPSGAGTIISNSVAADGSGNVYITGYYYNSAPTFGSTTLAFSSVGNIFIVKYSPAGNVVWARGVGGTGFDQPRSIATDGSGNVYITGVFDSPSITFGATTLTNAGTGNIDMFIAKYDTLGNVLWAKRAGGTKREFAEAVTVDFSGNVYVSGSFESTTVTFGSVVLTNTNTISEDIYLVKYDPAGNVLWARSGGGTGLEWATCVATDPFGNVVIAGPYYSASITFGTTTLVNPFPLPNEEMFIVKYDSSGNVLWVRGPAGTGYDELYSVAADAFGNVFVAGVAYSDSVTFGSTVVTNPLGGYYDMILAKYDSSGSLLWAKKPGGSGSDYAYALAVDASGNAYVTGYFDSDTLFFDASSYVLINPNYYADMFVAKYNPAGNVIWAKSAGGIAQPSSFGYAQQDICLDGKGNVYTVGSFNNDSLYFDAHLLQLTGALTNTYLAKLNDTGLCSANFTMHPDSLTPHLYYALNQATGTAPLSWLWSWGDGTFDTIPFPNHTYAVSGFYTICLTITDASLCSHTVCRTPLLLRDNNPPQASNPMVYVNVVSSIPTGMHHPEKQQKFSLYPNPAWNGVTITIPEIALKAEVRITSIKGEVMYEKTIRSEQRLELTTTAFAAGIYFVRIQTPGFTETQKLVVVK